MSIKSASFWSNLTFWLFLIGLAGDVIVAVIAAVNFHNKRLTKSKKHTLEKWLEWSAALSAVLVLFAILSEHHLDNIRENDRNGERLAFQALKDSVPRSLSLGQQRLLISQVWMDKPPFKIFLDETVPDAEPFGKELADVFSKCGFKFNGFINGIGLPEQHGVFVGENGTNGPVLNQIVEALNRCGFNASTNKVSPHLQNEIIIQIGNK